MPTATIPGPKGHFLTGNLPEMRRDHLAYLLDLRKHYGDVVRLRLGPSTVVVLFHPDNVQRVLQDNHLNYSKETRGFDLLKPLLGSGLLVSNGDFWLRQRRLMQPAFHRQQINSFGELMVKETLGMLENWDRTLEDGQALDVHQEMMRLTLAIVTQALFGSRVSDTSGAIGADISLLLSDSTFRFDHPFYPPLSVPTKRNRQFKQARQEMDGVIYALISERGGHEAENHDLLSLLMQAQDEENGGGMSDGQLRDEVMTLFLAGHETTAVALSWMLYLLTQHPEVESRLRGELEAVLQRRLPTLSDLPGLEYTRMVVDESLRLYPPAWITERKALGNDEIGGYPIPAGTTLAVSPYVTQRHDGFWDQPERFDPERFNPEKARERPRYAYFPFGGGPRQCIGSSFALLEAPLVLAAILQRFRFELAPGWNVEPEPLITLRPKGGLWMAVKKAPRL